MPAQRLLIEILSCRNRKWLAIATSIELGQSAHPYSLTGLYTVGCPSSCSHIDFPKRYNGQLQKLKVDYFI